MKEEELEYQLGAHIQIPKEKQLFTLEDLPAVILINPKYSHNIGAAIRGCSCYGAKTLIFTGTRCIEDIANRTTKKGYRLPREERMRGYKDVTIYNDEYPFNRFPKETIPIAIEFRHNSEWLPAFEHPKNAIYVFGPEDGSISQMYLMHCHRFVMIPSKHCLNLAVAVNTVLYERNRFFGVIKSEDIEAL